MPPALFAQTNEESVDASAPAPTTLTATASGKSSFDQFKIIADRNIFNGSRSGQRITSTRSSSQQRSVRVDAFSLVGTLLSDREPTAFFDGTEPDFRKVLRSGDRIAGFAIDEIHHTGIRLLDGTNALDMRVGDGMRRENSGPWKYTHERSSFASSGSSRSSDNGSGSYSASSRYGSRSEYTRDGDSSDRSSGSGGSEPDLNADEVLKRLMEKRANE